MNTPMDQTLGANLGFIMLPKDTSTCILEGPEIELLGFRLGDDPLFLLSYRSYKITGVVRVQIALIY